MNEQIVATLKKIREQKPVILCLTNYVSAEFVANVLLAIGAAPIMSSESSELKELVKISSAIYINIGTLNQNFMQMAEDCINYAKKQSIPIIFDPVGSGATTTRTNAAKFISAHADVIRGNASEIISLNEDRKFDSKGVESVHSTSDAEQTALLLAKKYNCTVIVSGAIDFVCNNSKSNHVYFGSPIMQNVTGMGCAMSGLISAFLSVTRDDPYFSCLLGTTTFSFGGQIASKNFEGTGTFKTKFLDILSNQVSLQNETFKNLECNANAI